MTRIQILSNKKNQKSNKFDKNSRCSDNEEKQKNHKNKDVLHIKKYYFIYIGTSDSPVCESIYSFTYYFKENQ